MQQDETADVREHTLAIWPKWMPTQLILHDAIADDAVRLLGWREGTEFIRQQPIPRD